MVLGASVADDERTSDRRLPDELLVRTAFARPSDVFQLPSPESVQEAYRLARPYPHLVIDGFFKGDVFSALQRELIAGATNFSQVFTDEFQTNKTISTGDSVPPLISLLAAKFAAPETLRYLERVTGLKRLVPDPYYNTDYGYYHIVGAGGVLGSHVDHARHSSLNLPHVLNVVVYLTDSWDPVDGGALCLYDTAGREIVRRIACAANRAVLFACTPTAYHGVEPITKASGKRRHSLYFAYYSVEGLPVDGPEAFPASQGAASNADAAANYSTYFVVPLTQLFRPKNWIHLRTRLIYLANLCLPPIAVKLAKKVLRAFR
jgi:hypothetical protein